MAEQLTSNNEALRLFFTDDVYLIANEEVKVSETAPVKTQPLALQPQSVKEEAVSVPAEVQPVSKQKRDFNYLGKNERNILILVSDPINQVSTEEGRELLRKIVKAIDLSAADFALVNCSAYADADFEELQNYFKPRLLLSFGVSPETLGLTGQQHNTVVKYEGLTLVFSSGLQALSEDMGAKKALWGSLKQLNIS
ncbi:hypothetical protein DBR11_29135 [Pedobacter sp. HMWF019]|uniref:hypothetical protein n=1 Tax=Pedobacter sp. HMWF019 TaxID=2056856 RepID=UPI000D3CA2C1|nr:hypothetical protein [Pedobacter sp. HMWF019]PTS91403.1 hypothetical protein DBR11_29135 [Pedobacter sp. HMWF019]